MTNARIRRIYLCRNGVRRGGAMVEMVVASLIVGVLMIPVLHMLGYAANSYVKQSNLDVARLLAEELVAEISAKNYAEPNGTSQFGPEADESNRAMFDDIDDYHGLVESPPVSMDGTPLPGMSSYRRTVTVVYAERTTTSGVDSVATTSTPGNLKKIQVDVFMGDSLLAQQNALFVDADVLRNADSILGGTRTTSIQARIRFKQQLSSLWGQLPLLNHFATDSQ